MCDERTFEENRKWLARRAEAETGLSRRDVARTAGAVLAAATLPAGLAVGMADAALAGEPVAGVKAATVSIPMPEKSADAFFAHPEEGSHAAVLVWPDAFGYRPALRDMGLRLARAGYAALVVNPYYRLVEGAVLPDDVPRSMASFEKIKSYYLSLTPDKTMADARGFIEWLDGQAAVDTARQMGTIGFCMGGPMVLRTAAAVPGRVGAGAAFHPGDLAGDSADSPHRLIAQMDAGFLIALGLNDAENRPKEAGILGAEFAKAGLDAEIHVYPAQHGWVPTDTEVHDPEQAELAWARMLALFDRKLA